MTSSPSAMIEVEQRMVSMMQKQELRLQNMMEQMFNHLSRANRETHDVDTSNEWDAVSPINNPNQHNQED